MGLKKKIDDMIQEMLEKSLTNLISNANSNKTNIRKTFRKLNNKTKFVKEKFAMLPAPIEIQEELLDFLKNNPDSIDYCALLSLDESYRDDLQNDLYSRIISGELEPSPDLFENSNMASISLDNKLHLLETTNFSENPDFISSLLAENDIQFLVSDQLKSEFRNEETNETTKKIILNTVLKNPSLLTQDKWIEIFNTLANENIQKTRELIKEVIPEDSQEVYFDELIEQEKEQYLRTRLYKNNHDKEEIIFKMEKMLANKDFKKYKIFRRKHFVQKQHVLPELLDSMDEFKNNEEIITLIMNMEEKDSSKYRQFLVEYLQDRKDGQQEKISTLEELEKYPELVLQRQKKLIDSGKEGCREVLIKNITGFSSEQFENLQQMFLNGHDIEEVLRQNNISPETYHTISELVDFIDLLDDEQLREFAQNVAIRNYNELSTQDSTLINTRNQFKNVFSNIISEYGKEFNSELGYDTYDNDGIKTIRGPFLAFISQKSIDRNLEAEDSSNIEKICLSLISEGWYEKYKRVGDGITYLYDYVPEDLLLLSSDTDMKTDNYVEKGIPESERAKLEANFRTALNTVLLAKKKPNNHNYTESTYLLSGFDKEENFVQVKPKAIGIWSKDELTPELEAKADELGVEIVLIPDMQKNLSYMLENGQVTPSLVKGIDANSDNFTRILSILENKENLTNNDFISLALLQEKVDNPELQDIIKNLLQKKEITLEAIQEQVEDVSIDQLKFISNETRDFYMAINNPNIERGEEIE